MRKVLLVLAGAMLLAAPAAVRSQAGDDAGARNAQQARETLDAMVQALGGQAWLDMKNQMYQGTMAAFYHGVPDLGTTLFWQYHAWPEKDRLEYTKHRDVLQFYLGQTGTEVTYRGRNPLPQEQVDDFLRRRDHSVETVVKKWLKDPKTILIYEGQHIVERHVGYQVTLISAENEAVTILVDTQTHLPLRRTFEWRDPVYHDKNVDAEEYDDYHVVDGFPTPYTITRYKNDEMIRQIYLTRAAYNQTLDDGFWDVDAATRRIKK